MLTLEQLMQRHRRIQEAVVDYSRNKTSEAAARSDLWEAGLSADEAERIIDAIKRNIIVSGTP